MRRRAVRWWALSVCLCCCEYVWCEAVLAWLLILEVYASCSRFDEQLGEFHHRADTAVARVAVRHYRTEVVHPAARHSILPILLLLSLSLGAGSRVEQAAAECLVLLAGVKLLRSKQLVHLARHSRVRILHRQTDRQPHSDTQRQSSMAVSGHGLRRRQ